MIDKLEEVYNRYRNLEESLADPILIADLDRYAKVNKEYKELQEIAAVYQEYRQLLNSIASAKEMLKDPDKEMREMAVLELEELEPQEEELAEKARLLLIPKDPEDTKDVIFEIRSGTGGDEASLFAGDLLRMYTRYFEAQGWKTELIDENPGTVGGYNKIVLEVTGQSVYGKLKFESGAHRVQRVPKTESQGRIHTSAATVVVMPQLEMEDVNINKTELKIDVFRASGAGGQHVNRTESAVRITHLPTGLVAESQDSRSQIKNREIALQRLYQRVLDARQSQHNAAVAAHRRSLVGTGDRSDKIRTYNFPQNRVTDHRINLTVYNLDQVLEGELNTIIEALQVAENAEKLRSGEA